MINILSPEVFNRIAAGEVVDRPYSVAKELIENALDAGATEITVETTAGGKFLRVTDNGCGIEKSDLKKAFLPHATSKLSSAEDLERIATLGFRGEAVASIASVSRMKIVSRRRGEECFSLSCDGGVLGEILPSAGADGTQVTVEELFFNTPARRKFLKSESQEEADVTNVVIRCALMKPQVSFTYLLNGKLRLKTLGDGLKSAIAIIYGASALENCYELDATKNGLHLTGFLGNTNFYKSNRTYQSLFVNGRYVVNQTVSLAILNAYSRYLMKRQYPFYILSLSLPPEIVDVNVHPNKADVRFADNQVVYGSVYSVVSSVLDGSSKALEFLAELPALKEEPAPKEAEIVQNTPSPQMSYREAREELHFVVSEVGKNLPFEQRRTQSAYTLASSEYEAPEEDVFAENQRLLRQAPRQDRVDPHLLVYKGELFHTYLIYEMGDAAYFVDQHAAHERLLYDKLKARADQREIAAQSLLLPYILNVNPQEFVFLQKNLQNFRELGFEIEEFGGSSFKISSHPAELTGIDLKAFFSEVLSSLETLRAIKLSEIFKDRLAMMACKAAVKGGEQLSDGEVRALLEGMDGDMGIKCPHGRPACVKMKKSELEKLFKRIV